MSAQTVSTRQANSLSALRNLNFRLYFFGQMISIRGHGCKISPELSVSDHSIRTLAGIVACAGGLPLRSRQLAASSLNAYPENSITGNPVHTNAAGINSCGINLHQYRAGLAHCPAGYSARRNQRIRHPC